MLELQAPEVKERNLDIRVSKAFLKMNTPAVKLLVATYNNSCFVNFDDDIVCEDQKTAGKK